MNPLSNRIPVIQAVQPSCSHAQSPRSRSRWSAIVAVAMLLLAATGLHAQAVSFAPQPLGTPTTLPINVTVAGGTVSTVQVLTRGVTGLEFVPGNGPLTAPACAAGTGSATTCQVSVTFTPAYPGVRSGAVQLLDINNNVVGTTYLTGIGQGGLDVLTPGNFIPAAGSLNADATVVDGILATNANLSLPSSVAFDGLGNMYIADSGLGHNRIRMVCAGTKSTIFGTSCTQGAGYIEPVAGSENTGYTGDGGLAAACTFNTPEGVAIDGAGNLYIADIGNHVIRKVTAATGIITTVAGNGTAGDSGDGGAATSAEFVSPIGVTVDATGNLYIADYADQRIRRVDAVTGLITTAAGNGAQSASGLGKGTYSGDGPSGLATAAGLSQPYAVAFDASGNMYIPDSGNNRIRLVKAVNGAISATQSTISTIAGNGNGGNATCPNGNAASEALNTPEGVAVDPAGNFYIADTQDACIRKVDTVGAMTTLAMNQQATVTVAGVPSSSHVDLPQSITVDGLGNLFVADPNIELVNEIQSNKAVLSYVSAPVLEGTESATYQTVAVANDGNIASKLTALTPDANAALDPSSTCTASLSLPLNPNCLLNIYFAPSTTGDPLLGNVYVSGNTVNDNSPTAPMDVVLIGDATQFLISLAANPPNSSAYGTPVSFTATVTSNKGNPAGSVIFTDSFNGGAATTLATVTLSSGKATYTTATLAVGPHVITAAFTSTTSGADSNTASVDQAIYESTNTILTASPVSPSVLGTPVVLTAIVNPTAGGGQTLSGTVTFTDSAATLPNNTVTVTTAGATATATYNATNLPQGANNLTAVFTPSNPTLVYPSTGNLSQRVQAPAALTLTSGPSPSTYGSAVTFTAAIPTVGTIPASGSVSVAIVPQGQTNPVYNLTIPLTTGIATISTLPVGSYTATATYAGDANYATAKATLATPQVVNAVTTGTAAIATPTPAIAGKPVVIVATVAPTSGTIAPTGSATFVDTFNGTTAQLGGGAITLTKTGTATINPTLAVGTHSILITYSGDLDDAQSSYTLSLVANAATTTTTVTASPNPAVVGATITFTATVIGNGGTPTGTVAFTAASANSTINLGTGTLKNGTASVTSSALPAGTYQLTATYAGDANNAAGTPGTASLTVGTIPTLTDLTTATTTGNNPQTILVTSVSNNNVAGPIPQGSITFLNGSTTVGTVTLDKGGSATLTPNLGAGTYNIVASYSGDSTHSPSQSSAVSVTTLGSSYSITTNPTAVSVATTQNAIVTVTLTSVSGFTDTVGLGCASLPVGVTCHFSNPSTLLPANGTATAQLTIDTNNPLGGGATAMNQPSSRHTMEIAGLFLPFSMMMGWLVWRFRKRNSSVWSVVLILALSGAAFMATGCIGFTQSSAAAGTYAVQVVGVGVNSNVPAYQTVTLTITK